MSAFCLFLYYTLAPPDSQTLTPYEDDVPKVEAWILCLQQSLDLVCQTTIDNPSVLTLPFLRYIPYTGFLKDPVSYMEF